MTEHHGWLYFDGTAGLSWSLQHPVTSGQCPNARSIRPATAEVAVREMLSAWRALMDAVDQEWCEAASLSSAL